MADGPNLFARLHKWAVRQDENFLTESLAVVLEQLLLLAPDVGVRLIGRLTGGFIEVQASEADSIEIDTQVEAGSGRPDLEIKAPQRLTWVEVKAESELRAGQLEGYRVLLGESGAKLTRLVLLTRYREQFTSADARPDAEVRWLEVADWLESELAALAATDDVANFLARQFLNFLRVRRMTLTHVEKYMPEGLRALGNLLNMLVEAAAACKVPAKKTASWDNIGLNLDGLKYWLGISLAEPEKLWFGTRCRIDPALTARLGVGELDEENWVPGRYRWWRSVELDSEEVYFYSRGKVSQLEWLESFLQDCLTKARSIETPEQPPLPEDADGA